MENSNESQDPMSTSPTLTGSDRRPVAVENIHVESTELLNAAGADQVSNDPGDVVAPLGADVIGDMNCEEDTEIRKQEPQVNGNQPPVCSKPQPSEQENVSLKQPQDGEKRSEHRCIICKINVLVFGCCQRTAHDECLHACDLSLTNCNCFQREKTIKRIDYPDTPTSKRKQPVHHDDLSETWEDHPLQTHERHSKVESLFCYLCNTEEIFIMPPCCDAHYHYHCIGQYKVNRYTTCPHCQGPLQPIPQMNNPLQLRTPPGDRSGGGGDDSGSNGEGGGGGGGGGAAAGGAAEGAAGGGGRGHHGRRVGVNALGENNLRGGADIQGGGDGEGGSENMEGDEDEVQLSVLQVMLLRHFLSNQSEGDGVGDDGRGGDGEAVDEGDVNGGGSPLPSQPPQQLVPPHSPSADDRNEEEHFERRVDDWSGYENSDHYEEDE